MAGRKGLRVRDPRRFILLVLVAAALAACGPTIETRYSYTLPANPSGMACVQQCEASRSVCVRESRYSLDMCKEEAHRRAEREYHAYLRTLRRGEKPEHGPSYYDTSYSCKSVEWQCKREFNDCYAACGGQVVTQRFCTSDCDQLKPPVPLHAQVGPTLVNGVAQHPPRPVAQKTPQTAAQRPYAGAPAGTGAGLPAGTEVVLLAQRYRITGVDYDGSDYEGTVTVRPEGGRFRFRWTIGSEIYNGVGTLAGDRLTIDGSQEGEPFRYDLRLFPDGSLMGKWTSGDDGERGSEEWRPS